MTVSMRRACLAGRTDGIVFHHAQWPVGAWAHQGPVVARHGHGDQTHHDGAGFRCSQKLSAAFSVSVWFGMPMLAGDGAGIAPLLPRRHSTLPSAVPLSVVGRRLVPFFAIFTRRWGVRALNEPRGSFSTGVPKSGSSSVSSQVSNQHVREWRRPPSTTIAIAFSLSFVSVLVLAVYISGIGANCCGIHAVADEMLPWPGVLFQVSVFHTDLSPVVSPIKPHCCIGTAPRTSSVRTRRWPRELWSRLQQITCGYMIHGQYIPTRGVWLNCCSRAPLLRYRMRASLSASLQNKHCPAAYGCVNDQGRDGLAGADCELGHRQHEGTAALSVVIQITSASEPPLPWCVQNLVSTYPWFRGTISKSHEMRLLFQLGYSMVDTDHPLPMWKKWVTGEAAEPALYDAYDPS